MHRTPSRTDRPLARKRFGQHYLVPEWAEKVVRAIAPTPDQTFLEIGPGPGALTHPLALRAGQVLAFEIDRDLAQRLRQRAIANLRVIEGDFLALAATVLRQELATLATPIGDLRVAGNLPYNVASPILFKLVELFEEGVPIRDATVMLQREVADRLLASPGSKDYGVLTVLIRRHADVSRLVQVPPGAFRPAPKVQSTVVTLRFRKPDPTVEAPEVLTALTQAIFSRRRKALTNALLAYPPAASAGPALLLAEAGIDGLRRPETLTLTELGRLSDAVSRRRPEGHLAFPATQGARR